MAHPDWVLKHKIKGSEVKHINGNYYLYKVSSRWNKEKKRSEKISGKLIGRITTEGLCSRSSEVAQILAKSISVKEYGASHYLYQKHNPILQALRSHFPDWHKELFALSIYRLLYHAPLKNMPLHYEQSYLSELLPAAQLSDKKITALLRSVGSQREQIVNCLKALMEGNSFILLDVTHITSFSDEVDIAQVGYNSQRTYDPQVNLFFMFSTDLSLPVYYRLLPGNVRDVSAMKLSIVESGLQNVTIVADKGFCSQKNIADLDEAQLKYLLPLRRNSSLVSYTPLHTVNEQVLQYFIFKEQPVWYYTIHQPDSKRVIVFVNDYLKAAEKQDFIQRIENKTEGYDMDKFYQKKDAFGTLALITNLAEDHLPEQIYQRYKTRTHIEQLFDVFKNILHADRTYMRGGTEMEAWLFINFLATAYYYQLYRVLTEKGLLKKYTPKDILLYLSGIKALKINQKWEVAEIPKKTAELIAQIEKPIT